MIYANNPGDMTLTCVDCGFAFNFPQVRNWIESTARDLSDARHVHMSIDTVIFDDGLILGEDCSGLGPHFAALV